MTPQYKKFRDTLDEIFMLDHAELDFGIYRIMNQKRADIADYLDNRLEQQVVAELKSSSAVGGNAEQEELSKLIETLTSAGMNPDDSPKVQELKAKLKNHIDPSALEAEVYSHLSTFFKRYYDGGDFMSMRRYKKDVYAIPYEGEEVKLHWANADQYYIKTSEYFQNYTFKVGDKTVTFSLRDASTEQNNNKAQGDKERKFKICEDDFMTIEGNTLTIWFTYEPMPKSTKQPALLAEAFDIAKAHIIEHSTEWAAELMRPMPTEKNKKRTLLEKHLNDYVSKNTFDYFIHKDLGAFLRRELDFYIKNEVLFIDDISTTEPERFLTYLSQIKTIKSIGERLITFLAQLEDFQKKLWLKKKFVVESNYCITLDRVPEELYPEVAANDKQREEWIRLFAIDEIASKSEGLFSSGVSYSSPLSVEFLSANPYLVLDTALFDDSFKQRLIASIDNLDEQLDGTLINSENFQALNLLQEKYQERVKCVYIDPPYNTDASKILYKNNYEHSSWISLIESRLTLVKEIMSVEGVIELAIDDYELRHVNLLMDNIFGVDNMLSNIAIYTNPKGRDQGFIAQAHDYSLLYAKDKDKAVTYNFHLDEEAMSKKFSKIHDGEAARELPLKRTGTGKRREERPYMYFPFIYHIKDNILSVIDKTEVSMIYNKELNSFDDNYVNQLKYDYEQRGYAFILPLDKNGEYLRWRWGYDSCVKGVANGELFAKLTKSGYSIYQHDNAQTEVTPKSLWFGERYDASSKGTNLLENIIPNNPFDYPKSLYTVEDNIIIGSTGADIVLDFFGGSGTTAHAVINLNRADCENGKRKFILVEVGSHFDSVIMCRVKKVIYSKDWKDGKPVSREGSSHCFKYVRLESYEDTLNNLTLQGAGLHSAPQSEFGEGFMLGYMLDTQARGSLFNTEWFANPFDFRLKITRNNELVEQRIDLIETFNYLIGLNVISMQYPKAGLCVVEGVTRRGEKTLVVWRDCGKVGNKELNETLRILSYNTLDTEFDQIYVNGDNTLQNTRRDDEHWKVNLIEAEFGNRMFEK